MHLQPSHALKVWALTLFMFFKVRMTQGLTEQQSKGTDTDLSGSNATVIPVYQKSCLLNPASFMVLSVILVEIILTISVLQNADHLLCVM